ncbi:MAG: thioredoxin domain-containing protein [Patescibacteria group bacterium]
METNTLSQKISIPGAIVVAGVLIAAAIYFSRFPATSVNTQETPSPSAAVEIRKVTANDHLIGSPDAPIILVEFSDTECPFCKQYHATLHTLVNESKDQSLTWVYRHFPIPQLHPKAPREAQALECAAELGGSDGFWKYTDELYRITPSNDGLDPLELPAIATRSGINATAFNTCLESGKYASKVEADRAEAITAGGRGTPFSVVVLKNALSADSYSKISQLAQAIKAQTQQNIIIVSSDKKQILLNGALPIDLMREIISGAGL